MKIITVPCENAGPTVAVRPGRPYWDILCSPGPLAELLQHLAQEPGALRTELIDGQCFAIIPLTPALDAALVNLVDTLITLRYETGRVQLELFSLKEV